MLSDYYPVMWFTYAVASFRFCRTKRKDLCMIDSEKQDFMEIMELEIMELEISVHMGYLFIQNPSDSFAFE